MYIPFSGIEKDNRQNRLFRAWSLRKMTSESLTSASRVTQQFVVLNGLVIEVVISDCIMMLLSFPTWSSRMGALQIARKMLIPAYGLRFLRFYE